MPSTLLDNHSCLENELHPCDSSNQENSQDVEKYKSILEGIPETILRWRVDDNKITYCNERFSRFEGRPPAEIIGTNIFDFVPENSVAEYYESIANTTTDEEQGFMLRRLDAKQKQHIIKGTIRAIADETGNIVEYQSTARDETEAVIYLETLEALIDVSGSVHTDHQARLELFILHGCHYFGMEYGFMVAANEDKFETLADRAPARELHSTNTYLKAVDNLCHLVAKDSEPIFIHNTQNADEPSLNNLQQQDIQCFIGIPIIAYNKLLGIALFFSTIEPRSKPFSVQNESFAKMLGQYVSHDMENERYQKALLRNEEELQLIFNSLPANIQYKDDKNNVIRLNQAAAEAMGLTIEQATGASIYDIFPQEAKKYHDDDLAVLENNQPLLKIIEENNADGNDSRWSSIDKIPINIPSSKERGILVAITDITEMKNTQKQLEKLNNELDESRKKYKEMYRSTPAMMYSSDDENKIIEVSDHWLEKLGYDRNEVIGQSIQNFHSPNTDASQCSGPINQCGVDSTCTDLPCEFVHKSGQVMEAELSCRTHTNDEFGQSSLNVLVDVTERNVAWRVLETRNQELTAANEGLDRFAYIASHDLQEPLRKIQQFGDILHNEHRSDLNQNGQYFVDVITSSAKRLSLLIKSILAYSKTSNATLDLKPVNLNDCIQTACESLEVQISESMATIKVADLPTIVGDEYLLQQLFSNLIINSTKYSYPGRAPKIEIKSSEIQNGGKQISIKDNGCGIDENLLCDIFRPFLRGLNNNLRTGSGIGLAICQAVCERHDWTITVDSTVDVGTTFTINIPGQIAGSQLA